MKKKVKRKIAVLAAMLSIGQARGLAMDSSELKTKTQSNSQLTKDLAMGAVTILGGAGLIWGGAALAKYLKNKNNDEMTDLSNINKDAGKIKFNNEKNKKPAKLSINQETGEINLNSVKNIRFLGWKMKGENGNLINDKAFIRSGNTNELTPEDLAALKELGVKTVIDLRYSEEVEDRPDKFSNEPGVKYENITILVEYGSFKSANEMIQDYCEALGSYGLKEAIKKTKSKNARKNIKKIFETIANTPEDGKILFHCSHGKDRTGILSMLILSLAGVSKEDIVKNFLECYNKDGKSKVQTFTKAAVEKFIDFLTKRYGDVEKFLKDKCGVSDETIKKVKKRIISP